VTLADSALQPITAAQAFSAQIDDRAQALPRKRADIVRGWLGGTPCPVAQSMLVEVQQPENTVIDEEHVKILNHPSDR
jgi:hypothetical protein